MRGFAIPPEKARLVVEAAKDGVLLTSIAHSDGSHVFLHTEDGGVRSLLKATILPDELAVAEDAHFAFTRAKEPYAELIYVHDGVSTTLAQTIGGPISPKLGWLRDGSEFLIADNQGLEGCSDRPLIVSCAATPCSSRCLRVTNSGSAISATGGVVVAVSGSELSIFELTRETFDGGNAAVFADRTLVSDAGAIEFLSVSPDGQRAGFVAGYPHQRLVIFSPVDRDLTPVVNILERCSVGNLLASNTSIFVHCNTPGDAGPRATLRPIAWSGSEEAEIDLGPFSQPMSLAPHRGQVLRLTAGDAGVELQRVY